jgi:hypothetical protein
LATARAAACLCAFVVLAGCGGKARVADTGTVSASAAPDSTAALTDPIERRLRAAGYPVYPIAPGDPHAGALFYTQVDWATQHAFKFYVYPFPTASAATAYAKQSTAGQERFASFSKVATAGRIMFWASGGQYECYGLPATCETVPIVEKHFSAIVALAEGR